MTRGFWRIYGTVAVVAAGTAGITGVFPIAIFGNSDDKRSRLMR